MIAYDFRPISLTTSLYKIIAKTLSSRLKVVLPNIVSENQMTFVNEKELCEKMEELN